MLHYNSFSMSNGIYSLHPLQNEVKWNTDLVHLRGDILDPGLILQRSGDLTGCSGGGGGGGVLVSPPVPLQALLPPEQLSHVGPAARSALLERRGPAVTSLSSGLAGGWSQHFVFLNKTMEDTFQVWTHIFYSKLKKKISPAGDVIFKNKMHSKQNLHQLHARQLTNIDRRKLMGTDWIKFSFRNWKLSKITFTRSMLTFALRSIYVQSC